MNKGELVDRIAQNAETAKKQAEEILTATIETILEAVALV